MGAVNIISCFLLLCVYVAVRAFYDAVKGIRTGLIGWRWPGEGEDETYSRAYRPLGFWFAVALHVGLGVTALIMIVLIARH